MKVIAHHGVGMQFNGKELREELHAFDQPLLAMTVVSTRILVVAAQPAAPHTSGNQMVEERLEGIHEFAARCCHGAIIDACVLLAVRKGGLIA